MFHNLHRRTTLLAIACLLTVISYAAGNEAIGKVSGMVKEAGVQAVLEYANVVLYRTSDSALVTGTITGPDGIFNLQEVPYGDYYLVIQFIGYKKKVISGIKIDKNNKLIKIPEAILEPLSENLREATISGERINVEYKLDKKVVNVASNLNSTGGSASDALQNVPSVSVDAEGNVSLRGSTNFTVLIDGRPCTQDGNDVLKQTPASSIENIEIISNPSAKYNPEGTSGIINLIMKKEKTNGTNGVINMAAGKGGRYSSDFTLNCKKGKINSYFGAEIAARKWVIDQVIDRKNTISDTIFSNYTLSDRANWAYPKSINAGIDYDLSSKTKISASGDYGIIDFHRIYPSRYHNYSDPSNKSIYYLNSNDYRITGLYGSGNISVRQELKQKGQVIDIMMYFSDLSGDRVEKIGNANTDETFTNVQPDTVRKEGRNGISRQTKRFQVDYTHPFNENSKFETGVQADIHSADYSYSIKEFDFDQNLWTDNSIYSNRCQFRQDVSSIYANFSSMIKGFEYQAGLRYESMDRKFEVTSIDEKHHIIFSNFFPSASISKQLKGDQQLQLSYSKRINRPYETLLNPFPSYSDASYKNYGNPELGPEYIYSYEANYMKRFKTSSLNIGLFYRMTDKSINQVFIMDKEGVLHGIFDNVGSFYYTGLELNVNITTRKILNINVIGNAYYQHFSDFERYSIKAEDSYSCDLRLVPKLSIPKWPVIQVTAYCNSKAYFAQGTMDPVTQIDFMAKQDFLNKKLTVAARVMNLFGLAEYNYNLSGEGYTAEQSMLPEKNVFWLSLSYKINNYVRINKKTGNVDTESTVN